MNISLFRLFLIFAKMGAILLGGGYVILPLIISEFYNKRKLLKQEEIMEFFALSQSMPGVIAVNISIFIGYKLKGIWGGISAMLGIIFAPLIIISLIGSVINILSSNSYVQSALTGIGIAVIVLIFLTIKDFWHRSEKNIFFYFIFILSLILLVIFKYAPIDTILTVSIIGLLIKIISKKISKKGDCQ